MYPFDTLKLCYGHIEDAYGEVGCVPEAFYRVRTIEGVWGYYPCMGPDVKPCDRT